VVESECECEGVSEEREDCTQSGKYLSARLDPSNQNLAEGLASGAKVVSAPVPRPADAFDVAVCSMQRPAVRVRICQRHSAR